MSRSRLRPALLSWFDAQGRDLPWRRTRDPYAIWLSEVMLQQTQVQTVIPYWERFCARFPTVEALAEASLDEVLTLWRGLGYYSRARNLHSAAGAIVERHGGRLPRTAEALATLPGFGRYTAGAVASIAFGQQAPLVDGNVARVLSRLFELDDPSPRARENEQWRLAQELVKGGRPGDWNQALMELGATVCTPRSPSCAGCPVRTLCGAHRSGRVEQLPPPKVRPSRKALALNVAVIRHGPRVLLGRREGRGLFGGLWELPSTEEPQFGSLLGPNRVTAELGTVRRTLTHRDLELRLFAVRCPRAPRKADGYAALKWASAEEAEQLGISSAMQAALRTAFARQATTG